MLTPARNGNGGDDPEGACDFALVLSTVDDNDAVLQLPAAHCLLSLGALVCQPTPGCNLWKRGLGYEAEVVFPR